MEGLPYPTNVRPTRASILRAVEIEASRVPPRRDSLGYWWETPGRLAYPDARRMLLLCDGGGSNASRRYVFKYHLEPLANRLGLEIRVAHYPPYCSKYNPIEHRFFPHVKQACQGLLLTSTEVTCQAMARTSTKKGLKTTVHVLAGDYPTGEGYPESYREAMQIRFDEELPVWNYRATPARCHRESESRRRARTIATARSQCAWANRQRSTERHNHDKSRGCGNIRTN